MDSMNVTSVNDRCLVVGDTVACEKMASITGITMILLPVAVVNCMEAQRKKN